MGLTGADRHRRLAQGVRSKEEPEESFLKSIPSDVERLEIIYPVSAYQLCAAFPHQQVHTEPSFSAVVAEQF